MLSGFFPHITLSGTDTRKGDGVAMVCNGQSMLIDGFEGGQPTNGLKTWLANNGVTDIDVAVLTHPHYDHYNGLLQIEADDYFHIKLMYCYDPRTLQPGVDSSSGGQAVQEDIDNAYKVIRKLQSYGTRVLFIDKGDSIQFGDITWKVYRNQPTKREADDDYGWSFVNDGSLALYSPETQLLFGGDGPANIKYAIQYFGGQISGYDIAHHGNSCSRSNAEALKNAGCVVAWESCVEAAGAGTTDWTEYGARRVKQQGIPVWMQNYDITFTCANGVIKFMQNGQTISKNVPYNGTGVAHWVKDSTGWYYVNADGTRAHGWQKIKWSRGEDWFRFNDNGYMQTGWVYDGGRWYYLDPTDGYMHVGWLAWKGKKCYLEPTAGKWQGHCYISTSATIDGKVYKFDKDGYATEQTASGTLNGVDVASYQSRLAPAQMSTTDFIIVKFTQGIHYLNPYAERQYSTAKAAGKLLGAYHYAEGGSAVSEAQYFVNNLGDRVHECILALDWEGNQNSTFGTGKDVAWCKTWLDEVYRLTGVRPFIYMSKSVTRKYNWSSVAQSYPLWCAQYASNSSSDYKSGPWTDSNSFGAWASDTIRQYSSHGSIAGYSGNIDINKAYMTRSEWLERAGGGADPDQEETQIDPIDAVLAIASAEVGTKEGANNRTKYGDEMHALQPSNMDKNAPWCDAFVDWCMVKAFGAETAKQVLCGDFDDYTYNSVALYKKAGRWSQTAHRGDQIFFGGSGHTGIVESVENGRVHTIEGNKSDMVKRCDYPATYSSIIGYGMPRYELVGSVSISEDYNMPLIKKGATGKAVKVLQVILDIYPDGTFGDKTYSAVIAFQKAHSLEADGEVGPLTWSALFNSLS